MRKLLLSTITATLLATTLFAEETLESVEALEMPQTTTQDETPKEESQKEEESTNQGTMNIAFKGGTLGMGIDFSYIILDNLNLRANINGFSYSTDEEIDDIKYDLDLDLMSVGVLADYYPFGGTFRLSGGAYYNNNEFKGKATPTDTINIEINNVNYSASDIGHLNANIDFDKFAPYLGLGWGNETSKKGLGFTFDLGVMYHGEPNVDLSATRGSSLLNIGNPIVDAAYEIITQNVEAQEQSTKKDIKDFKFYPVVMIGLNYTF